MKKLYLEKIALNDNLLLLCIKNSNFYKICLKHGLNNLQEIFDFFKNVDIEEKNKLAYKEIHGHINLLKYIYLDETIEFWKKLNRKTISHKGNKGDKADYLYMKYYEFFRSLGFASSEAFELCYELEYSEEIGNAIIRLYWKKIKSDKKIQTSQEHFVFCKKLEILSKYYLENAKSFVKEEFSNLVLNSYIPNNIFITESVDFFVKQKKYVEK